MTIRPNHPNINVWDGEFHPCPNSISSATKSEPSGNHALHSSGNGYKAIPVNKGSVSLRYNKHHTIVDISQSTFSIQ